MTSVVEFELRTDSGYSGYSGYKDGKSDQPTGARGISTSGIGELQESLPLFAENVFSDCMAQISRKPGLESPGPDNRGRKLQNRSQTRGRQDHLACAKRLSRAMRQIPTNSKQHIQAGRLVCRHLVAMLHDSPSHNMRISDKIPQ